MLTGWDRKICLIALLLTVSFTHHNSAQDDGFGMNMDPVSGFGAAQHFMPLPHTVVGAHCTWQLRLSKVPNRIPETITEVICHRQGNYCGGSPYYTCQQMKTKILVGFVNPSPMGGSSGTELMLRESRNITINIGCSCIYREPFLIDQFFRSPQEKRSGRLSRERLWDRH